MDDLCTFTRHPVAFCPLRKAARDSHGFILAAVIAAVGSLGRGAIRREDAGRHVERSKRDSHQRVGGFLRSSPVSLPQTCSCGGLPAISEAIPSRR